jgi:hypothetical protein
MNEVRDEDDKIATSRLAEVKSLIVRHFYD